MKTVFILLDSLNRRFLSPYGTEEITPNIQRLAERGIVFNNHWCGSAPCMPARRDLMTGRLNFLERPWGGIEPFDEVLPKILSRNGIFTQMITDHLHYFEIGGENYCNRFDCWEFIRGQEVDQWKLTPQRRKELSMQGKGHVSENYQANRQFFNVEEDFPTPKTLQTAASWIEDNHDCDDFFIWIEGFDPHEPFDTPEEYMKEFKDEYVGDEFIWPKYTEATELSDEERNHIVNRYKACLSMTDNHLGKRLDVFDKYNMWEDTTLIFTTDHGYMLGEHDLMAKNYMHAYNEIFHIPLIIAYPGTSKGEVNTLTQNIDIFPTVLELHDIEINKEVDYKIHGKSLINLIKKDVKKIRNQLIYGYFGKAVNITDGKYTYFCTPQSIGNELLNMYTVMPTMLNVDINKKILDDKSYKTFEFGTFLSWLDYPVIKMKANNICWYIETQNFQKRNSYISENLLFDIVTDYHQENPILNQEIETRMIEKLRYSLKEHDSPIEQFDRLGI